jgi:hypothetical protein
MKERNATICLLAPTTISPSLNARGCSALALRELHAKIGELTVERKFQTLRLVASAVRAFGND